MAKEHDCKADSNKQLVRHAWEGGKVVSTYRCRRCKRTWKE